MPTIHRGVVLAFVSFETEHGNFLPFDAVQVQSLIDDETLHDTQENFYQRARPIKIAYREFITHHATFQAPAKFRGVKKKKLTRASEGRLTESVGGMLSPYLKFEMYIYVIDGLKGENKLHYLHKETLQKIQIENLLSWHCEKIKVQQCNVASVWRGAI